MKLKARGDYNQWYLLSPEFAKNETQELTGKMGLEIASEKDQNLPTHEISKTAVKDAVKKTR